MAEHFCWESFRSSAPAKFRVWGWKGRGEFPERRLLREGTYSLEGRPEQIFALDDTGDPVDTVRLEVLTNHGHPSHTCLYRFRFHGGVLNNFA